MTDTPLPPSIESQLNDLELRHKRHQVKMEWQREFKAIRRQRHREGWHRLKIAPINLI